MFGFIIILAALVVLLVLFIIKTYNGLIRLRIDADGSWSDIDTQLKRRFDLIPNLVATVKGYATHESDVFEKVTQARNMAMNAKGPQQVEQSENMLQASLKSLFAVAENYPQLKADANFMNLQNTLSDIEDQINKARRYFNAVVRDYNTKLEVFPNNLIASMFSFGKRDFFMLDSEEEKKNVKVEF